MDMVGFETYGNKPGQMKMFSNAFTTNTQENEEKHLTEEQILLKKMNEKYNEPQNEVSI